MKLFACPQCDEAVFFENHQCVHCGTGLAYEPATGVFHAVPAHADSPAPSDSLAVRACGNRAPHAACNWGLAVHDTGSFCRACRLNEIIPDLSHPDARAAWIRLEGAKRRLLYTLMSLRLPVQGRSPTTPDGLAFAFKQDGVDGEKVTTGHADGLITINIAEADDASRETIRGAMGEPYRTVLGHFRHESGHYYWNRLIEGTERLESFRHLFGDERADYAAALQNHYEAGPTPEWPARHISAYASVHPWEDWAETWAHYLHMVDGVETTRAYGVTLEPVGPGTKPRPALAVSPPDDASFDSLLGTWTPVTVALNSFARGMGLSDVYPFAPSEPVIAKLRFVHDVVSNHATSPARAAATGT